MAGTCTCSKAIPLSHSHQTTPTRVSTPRAHAHPASLRCHKTCHAQPPTQHYVTHSQSATPHKRSKQPTAADASPAYTASRTALGCLPRHTPRTHHRQSSHRCGFCTAMGAAAACLHSLDSAELCCAAFGANCPWRSEGLCEEHNL